MSRIGMDVLILQEGKRVGGRVVAETGCQPCQKQYQVELHDPQELFWVHGAAIIEWTYPDDWEGPIII